MADTMDVVNNMFDQDYNEFKNNVNDILMNRIQDRVNIERIAVGQAMFNSDMEEEEIELDEPGTDYDYEDDTDEEI